ncbi:hypothetical protein OIU78_013660 [Salix suchowensis]|nr:hypothetical protein OIU78_013660 [Salix suchowensis]
MDDSPGRLNIIPDHFQVSTSGEDSPQTITSSTQQPKIDNSSRSSSHFWFGRKLRSAVFMLNLFSLRRLSWGYSTNGQEKVELESLRSELACVEEREAHLKAQLQHADEILRSARFSGYLYIRTVLNFSYLLTPLSFQFLLHLFTDLAVNSFFPLSFLPPFTEMDSSTWGASTT